MAKEAIFKQGDCLKAGIFGDDEGLSFYALKPNAAVMMKGARMSIKNGIFEIIGKTVKEVIINEKKGPNPDYHIFIVFDDSKYYEFYGDGDVNSGRCLYGGGEADSGSCLSAGTKCATELSSGRTITRYYKDKHGKNTSEALT